METGALSPALTGQSGDFGPEEERSLIDAAVALAAELALRSAELQTPAEKRQQAELDRMLQRPSDKATIVQLTDEVFRSHRSSRTAEHLTHILDVQGIPRFFSPLDQALLTGFRTFGNWLPNVAVPLVKEHMRQETANVVLPAEGELLRTHLRARQAEGVRMNVNFLGDSLLGEAEAEARLARYLEALQLPEIEVLSVKISTLCSQIAAIDREGTLRTICDRLEPLYREAAHLKFTRPDGTTAPKWIYLDMEEYRDLELTAEAFMRTLDRPGLEQATAGIALQAYVPDSQRMQRRITEWAVRRVARGGAAVAVRIVKGANMEAERVEAALRDWPQAPYLTKAETDAAYKVMLRYALQSEHLQAVRVGVASHNLFDVAYALLLAERATRGRPELLGQVQFEMLEGMANHQRRALRERLGRKAAPSGTAVPRGDTSGATEGNPSTSGAQSLLLYAPACRKEEFLNAVGYLLRRLDENTGPENFLRHTFKLTVGSAEWRELEQAFRRACELPVSDEPRRTQNRQTERLEPAQPMQDWRTFHNEPDTDFSLVANSNWASSLVSQPPAAPGEWTTVPVVIGERELVQGRRRAACLDPSRPGITLCESVEATGDDVREAVRVAKADPAGWRSLTCEARVKILGDVASRLRASRGRLLRVMVANAGKTVIEGDPEVSEAIDFVEFYRAVAADWFGRGDVDVQPRGVVVVVPPWNFPLAIPCGGIAAALAAGNTVILKPASATVLVAWELCRCFWEAGVPRSALAFVPCPGSGAGAQLIADPDVDAVILTGGTETALRMLAARPGLRLLAETGGKNGYIITALSDRELAIKHVVQSAFGHAGQKCSATSLLLLEAEVYDDPKFREQLADAVKSLPVGSAWSLSTRVGPLIRPASGELDEALRTLEPGESWLVRPLQNSAHPNLWSPGVKWGVTGGTVTHLTEFFGPVLGVMRFERLEQAIDLVNATGYGLTSGLASLDEREHTIWRERIRAGNLYINRGTTGAIVLRQPFGGWGASGVGPGFKAGGPNYLVPLMTMRGRETAGTLMAGLESEELLELEAGISRDPAFDAATRGRLARAFRSYESAWRREFSREQDHFGLLGQDNIRRYRPFGEVRVRVSPDDTAFDLFARVAAIRRTGARVVISAPVEFDSPALALLDQLTALWGGRIEFLEESDEQLAAWLIGQAPHANERLSFANSERVPFAIRQAAAKHGRYVADEPMLGEGRVDLLWFLREQSESWDYHRYGNVGTRQSTTAQQM